MAAYDALAPPASSPVEKISVVCPVFDTPATMLTACVLSFERQTYRSCELVLVDDGSTNPETIGTLSRLTDRPGIRVISMQRNRGIAAATNRGIEAADGRHVAFLDHDDLLCTDALDWISLGLDHADAVYTDEDQITVDGDRIYPFMKPAWSPRLLLGMNYVNHLTAIRRDVLLDAGGLDDEYVGAQDHDLLLRLSEAGTTVSHVPKVLYHWRQSRRSVAGDVAAKPWALEAGRQAVRSAVARTGIDADVVDAREAGPYRFSLRFRALPGAVEIISGRTAADVNRSIRESTADVVVINPRGIDLTADDLAQLAGWLSDPGIFAVGPKILTEDGSVAEAGWIVSRGEARAYGQAMTDAALPFLEVAREATAVGGTVFAARRGQLVGAGGLDETLSVELSAVLLTARLGREGGGACIVEPSVAVVRPMDDSWSATLSSRDFVGDDAFVSPHKTTDGMTIDPPPPLEQRLQRLLPRFGYDHHPTDPISHD